MRLQTPAMGWNSFDCYGTAVTEADVRRNAEYMAKNLKGYGWEYVVVDIQWYEPNAVNFNYNKNAELVMDEYGRLMPAVNRFPSAAGGNGFRPLADYIHSLGLKFGIHILRGIPKQAIRAGARIKGTDVYAAQIADPGSVCAWNGDMCGIDMSVDGAQEYYNSIFELYASWGVDFVKTDDILRPYSKAETEAVRRAIENCGRDMVLSLSPGAAPLDEAEHLCRYADMWRMTDDFWDRWELLKGMFDYCRSWFPYVGNGHWPDCDMLPLGKICLCDGGGRMTNLTEDEQKLLMSLWAIFRSPLMFGGELTENDSFTLSLLQNEDIIKINQHSWGGHEAYRAGDEIVWAAYTDGAYIAAQFNTGNDELKRDLRLDLLGIQSFHSAREIWTGDVCSKGTITSVIPPHGIRLYEIN